MPGAPIFLKTRGKSPIGPIHGSAAIVLQQNSPTERGRLGDGAPAPSLHRPLPSSLQLIHILTNYLNMLITRRAGNTRSPDHAQPCPRCIAFKTIVTVKQNAVALFFGSLKWQNSRTPAGIERSFAVNFLQKQQKQWGPFQRDAFGKICRSQSPPGLQ